MGGYQNPATGFINWATGLPGRAARGLHTVVAPLEQLGSEIGNEVGPMLGIPVGGMSEAERQTQQNDNAAVQRANQGFAQRATMQPKRAGVKGR